MNKNKIEKKQIIKIPHNIKIFYSKKKKILIFKGFTRQKSLKINTLLTVSSGKQQIEITSESIKKLSNSNKKKIRLIQITTASRIKQMLIEASAIMYQKLKLSTGNAR